MCGGGNRNGVEGGLWDLGLWTSWRTLGSHQHHCRVGWCRVVRWHHTRLHVGLQVREGGDRVVFFRKTDNPFYEAVSFSFLSRVAKMIDTFLVSKEKFANDC